jgi:hypothetical protein
MTRTGQWQAWVHRGEHGGPEHIRIASVKAVRRWGRAARDGHVQMRRRTWAGGFASRQRGMSTRKREALTVHGCTLVREFLLRVGGSWWVAGTSRYLLVGRCVRSGLAGAATTTGTESSRRAGQSRT